MSSKRVAYPGSDEDLVAEHEAVTAKLRPTFQWFEQAKGDRDDAIAEYFKAKAAFEAAAKRFDYLSSEAEIRKLPGFSENNPNPDL